MLPGNEEGIPLSRKS